MPGQGSIEADFIAISGICLAVGGGQLDELVHLSEDRPVLGCAGDGDAVASAELDLIARNLVDPSGHVDGKPLPVIDLASMSQSQDHNQEHMIGNGVDDAVVANAHPIARTTSQGSGCWRPRVVGK